MAYEDILYETRDGVAWITINRPHVRNAFRTRTVRELTEAFGDNAFAEKRPVNLGKFRK